MDTNKLLDMIELKKGDFITVVRWVNSNDRSYVGECLQVKAIDHPFISVSIRGNRFWGNRRLTLDLNRVEIMPLSSDFVDDVLADEESR